MWSLKPPGHGKLTRSKPDLRTGCTGGRRKMLVWKLFSRRRTLRAEYWVPNAQVETYDVARFDPVVMNLEP